MNKPLRQAIPYQPDSALLFEAVLSEPWAVFLDSARPHSGQGRYDILAADPYLTLVTRESQTQITDRSGQRNSSEEPLQLIRQVLSSVVPGFGEIPFCGGAIGYWSYDFGRGLESLPEIATDAEHLPEMAIGIYDWALVVDHQQQQSWLVTQNRDPATAQRWNDLVDRFSTPKRQVSSQSPFRVLGEVRANMDAEQYAAGFERIQRYIRDGDCYQVNFAQRFEVEAEGSAWSAYQALRQANPAPFAAYLSYPFVQVLSCSPERFLQVRAGEVETKPIKGTCPRGTTPSEDAALMKELASSHKNRAENLMIVDLLRNDLGKSCIPGSIGVSQLFQIETYATVHHLVSTVTGRLSDGNDALQLLRGCFPGGSITGAPKLRAMEIIEELEPHRRGIYCGSIGYVGFDGNMDSNIAIRTLVHADDRIRFWAGGGIVADSVMEDEYRETFYKVDAMLRLLKQQESSHGADDNG